MGDLGIKAWLRLQLVMEGINFNDLKPKPGGGSGSGNQVKAHAEALMFRRGISVEDLKVGTFYHDPNYVHTEAADIDKKKKKEDDKDGNMTESSAMELKLQYATERLYRSSLIEEDDDDEEEEEEEDDTDPIYGLGIMDVAFAGMMRRRRRAAAYQKDNNQLSY